MKNKYIIRSFILMLMLIIVGDTARSFAFINAPQTIKANTNHRVIGHMYYDGYIIENEKIITDQGLGYCLEIEKDYPSGQEFKIEGVPSEELNRILAFGYPYLSAEALGLDNENDAYTATQMALWCVYEHYDINKINTENKKLLNAIKQIYNNAKNTTLRVARTSTMEYYYNNKLQRIVIYINDEGTGDITTPEAPKPPVVPEVPKPPVVPEVPVDPQVPEVPDEGQKPINPEVPEEIPGGK